MPANDRSYGTIEIIRVGPQRVHHPRRRSSFLKTCICGLCCTLVLIELLALLIYFLVVPFGASPGPGPRPNYTSQKFAVGFDLTARYGTAAVSFPNGTTINVATVEADDEYNEVMARLSLTSSQHPTPPYYSGQRQVADLYRQWRRRFRMMMGLPASDDVAALARLMERLKSLTEITMHPPSRVEYVFVTVPHLPALYSEDLGDASKYLGITLLTLTGDVFRSGDAAEWPVTEVNTAVAGNEFGLCEDFMNSTHCAKQIVCPEIENIFIVLYTRTAITAHVSPICNSMHFYAAGGIANFTLGSDSLPTSPTPEVYWYNVREALRDGLKAYHGRGNDLGLVIAHGESVDEAFLAVLRDEVGKVQDSGKAPRVSTTEPLFAAARGASEFAKRCMLTHIDCIQDLAPRGPGW